RLVGRDHEGGSAQAVDQVRERERLAAARDAEEHAVRLPRPHELDEAVDGPRLVPRGDVLRLEPERHRQEPSGTVTRYFRQESRKEVACGWRRSWAEKRNCGWKGSRIS